MELVLTPTGVVTFCAIALSYVAFARYAALGALSLPCVSLLTTMIYYYVMPSLAFNDGAGFLGVYIDSMEEMHWDVFLYAMGVVAACAILRRRLTENPSNPFPHARPFNQTAYWVLLAVAAGGLVTLTITNRLNLTGAEDFVATGMADDQFRFLQVSISMLLPLTIVYAVRDNFGPRSLAFLTAAAFVFLVSGFRYRIALLMMAVAASYSLTRGFKIGVLAAAVCTAAALMLFNALAATRRYSVGIDLSALEGIGWSEWLHMFGGEVGPTFAFFSVISCPPPELIGADPWIVAIARLVPTFLWPDKPYPEYLSYYTLAFDENTRKFAGIAGPQQAEILLQFGWFGLLIVPCVYFMIAIFISKLLNKLSREARIAGAALIPGVFGFFMQQRGYFTQNLTEALFIIGPLFLMHVGRRAERSSRVGGEPRAKSEHGDSIKWR